MEPLSALSAATAVCQFLDFSAKIVSGAWKVYNTEPGRDSQRNSHIRTITEDLLTLNKDVRNSLIQHAPQPLAAKDMAIMDLGEKCNELGRQLMQALDKLQKQPTSRRREVWDCFSTALRSVWNEDKINTLKLDLQNYRQQITMHLLISQSELIMSINFEQRQAINESKHDQVAAINSNNELCRQILRKVDGADGQHNVLTAIQHAYSKGAPGIMVATSPVKVNQILQEHNTDSVSQQFLHELHFRELNYRYERVALAHRKTFEWLFEPPAESSQWADFADWLRSDVRSLYWITGKAGAGKSTLMRFVVDHTKTRKLLRAWSNGTPLLTASFFFWNSGTEMQMSYEGMVRSLLYQILEQAPKLIPIAFPHRILDGMLFGGCIFGQQNWTWTWAELMEALEILLTQGTKTHKIMVFIDGMDEFKGDTTDVIDFVKRLAVPGVKVCASSRPWNQFRDAFGRGPHLRVEMLTYHDIEGFVTSKLSQSPAFADYEQSDPGYSSRLIKDVCDRSDGVFLWVHLVIKSLLEGLSDGEKPTDLQQRLESLPTDLEALFEKILWTLNTNHSERASQLFQIHRVWPLALTVLDLSFADEDDQNFAIDAPRQAMTLQQKNSRAALMSRRVNACTKGLLEMGTAKDLVVHHDTKVGLLHRTVRDYLWRPDVWKKVCATAPESFVLELRLSNCFIMRLKTKGNSYSFESLLPNVRSAMKYADSPGINPRLRDKLHGAVGQVYTVLVNARAPNMETTRETTCFVQQALETVTLESLLRVAVHYGHIQYLQGLKSLPANRKAQITSQCLLVVLQNKSAPESTGGPHLDPPAPKWHPQLVRVLLEEGADPNYIDERLSHGVSIWDLFLTRVCQDREYTNAEVSTIAEDLIQFGADTQNNEHFLQYKKNSGCVMEPPVPESAMGKPEEEGRKSKSSRLRSFFGRKK